MNISSYRNVLVLAPHTDDGELGAGGTINKLIRNGSKVTYVAFSIARQSVPEGHTEEILKYEVAKAVAELGVDAENLLIYDYPVRKLNFHRQDILELLVELRAKTSFDLVLVPSRMDVHQDHQTVTNEAVRAFKGISIFGYELIWNNLEFQTQAFSTLSDIDVSAKVRALECYISQAGRSYFDPHFIKSLAHVRGVQVGVKYAECFEVIRLRIE